MADSYDDSCRHRLTGCSFHTNSYHFQLLLPNSMKSPVFPPYFLSNSPNMSGFPTAQSPTRRLLICHGCFPSAFSFCPSVTPILLLNSLNFPARLLIPLKLPQYSAPQLCKSSTITPLSCPRLISKMPTGGLPSLPCRSCDAVCGVQWL